MISDPTALLMFDADCGMCARFAFSGFVRSARVRPIGYQSVARDAALARLLRARAIDQRLLASAMVLVAGERVYVGARAFNAILRRRGGWRAVAGAALSLPLVVSIEIFVYRVIAANRRCISGWLGASICTPSHQTQLDPTGGSPP